VSWDPYPVGSKTRGAEAPRSGHQIRSGRPHLSAVISRHRWSWPRYSTPSSSMRRDGTGLSPRPPASAIPPDDQLPAPRTKRYARVVWKSGADVQEIWDELTRSGRLNQLSAQEGGDAADSLTKGGVDGTPLIGQSPSAAVRGERRASAAHPGRSPDGALARRRLACPHPWGLRPAERPGDEHEGAHQRQGRPQRDGRLHPRLDEEPPVRAAGGIA
jgi:hypothetical protein